MNDRNNYRGGSRGNSGKKGRYDDDSRGEGSGQRRSYGGPRSAGGGQRGGSYGGSYGGPRGGGGQKRSFDGPREMHKATCSDCGKECEVPFRPAEGRPVYCNDCFPKHRKPRY